MTNKEAMVFMDNLMICINEHPVVADWLVEIASRKDEPNKCEICGTPKYLCQYCIAEDREEDKMWTPKTEPQIKCPKCGRSDYIRLFEDWGIDGGIYKYKCINCNTYIKDSPQTERPCDDCQEFDCYGCEYKQMERNE